MGKELTLEQLAEQSKSNAKPINVVKTNSDIKNAKQVSIAELAKNMPKEEVKEKAPVVVENAFKSMEETLKERKENIDKTMEYIKENAREMAIENELKESEEIKTDVDADASSEASGKEEETSFDIPTGDFTFDAEEEPTKETKAEATVNVEDEVKVDAVENIAVNDNTTSLSDDISDIDNLLKDLGEDTFSVNDTDTPETIEETRERYKQSLDDIKVTKDPIDFSTFKVRKNPISASTILNTINNDRTVKMADWVLLETKKNVRFSECSGPELDALSKTINNSNAINGVIASLQLIYNHIVDANKPKFEAWTKTVRTEDIESLYFGLYKACYGDANFLGRTCDTKEHGGCGKTSFIKTDINDMVKFDNDDVKNEFDKLFIRDTTTDSAEMKSKLIAASDDIAISYSEPTLYNTFIQFSTLPANITDKYSNLLNSMAYIDGFYKICKDTNELVPIAIKTYPNNLNKTILTKLKVYSALLKTLTNDQYNILTSKLANLIKEPRMHYIYPETTCPECGKTFEEKDIESMLQLLFTRAQLATIKSL